MALNAEQRFAFNQFTSLQRNVFLTGPGGTGKSFTIQEIVTWAKHTGKNISVTSSTGTSAIAIGGRTIHSYLGIGLAREGAMDLFEKAKQYPGTIKKLKALHCLVIDEISMVNNILFQKISDYLCLVRRNKDLPFGGLQVLLCGDLCQLPPVEGDFCFKAKAWTDLNLKFCLLRNMIRQDGDPTFQNILNEARFGSISDKHFEILQSCVDANFGEVEPTILYSTNVNVDRMNDERYRKLLSQGVEERIFTTQYSSHKFSKTWAKNMKIPEEVRLCIGAQVMLTVNVDVTNGLANGTRGMITEFRKEGPVLLLKNGSQFVIEAHVYKEDPSLDEGISVYSLPLKINRDKVDFESSSHMTYALRFSDSKSKAWAKKNDLEDLTLYNGMTVELTRTLSVDQGLLEGMEGTVISVDDPEGPMILFDTKSVLVSRVCFQPNVQPSSPSSDSMKSSDMESDENSWIPEVDAKLKDSVYVIAMPLRLAYAITIHKSQSATLDAAVLSLGKNIFSPGMAYTALSRVRNLQSVKILDIKKESFQVHPEVLEYYQREISDIM